MRRGGGYSLHLGTCSFTRVRGVFHPVVSFLRTHLTRVKLKGGGDGHTTCPFKVQDTLDTEGHLHWSAGVSSHAGSPAMPSLTARPPEGPCPWTWPLTFSENPTLAGGLCGHSKL